MSAVVTLPAALQPLDDLYEIREQHNAWMVRCLPCSTASSIGKARQPRDLASFVADRLAHWRGHGEASVTS